MSSPGASARQEEIQDISSTTLAWLVRWGITLFWGVLLLVGVAWFVRYPNTVVVPLQLISSNVLKPVTARASGRLLKLVMRGSQLMSQGTLLVGVEGPAAYAQVAALRAWQRGMTGPPTSQLPPLKRYTQPGEVQPAFETLAQMAASLRTFLPGGLNNQNKGLQGELAALRQRFASPETQRMFGEMAVPQFNFGKVYPGQRVVSRLEGYPYQEFGTVTGHYGCVRDAKQGQPLCCQRRAGSKSFSVQALSHYLKTG